MRRAAWSRPRDTPAALQTTPAHPAPPPHAARRYVLESEAGSSEKRFQEGLKRDCDARGGVLPARQKADGSGMTIDDFMQHPNVRAAKLKKSHVVALRYYTTLGFRGINNPLRDHARYEAGRPHPLPVTVLLIRKGLSLLRQVAATSEERTKTVVLYRGMQGVRVTEQFMAGGDGGTELAPMSTTSSLKVAMQYSAASNALLLRLFTDNFMVRGPSVSFLSCFPSEDEFLFPPLTCQCCTGRTGQIESASSRAF